MSGGSWRSSADEALEQQVVAVGIDRGDAEHVADRRVGGRAAALAEDVLGAGEADDRVHRQEIGRVVELARSAPAHGAASLRTLSGQALRIAPLGAFPGQLLQRLLRRQRRDRRLVRILVGELVEEKRQRVGDVDACARAPRDSGRTAGASPPAASGGGRHAVRADSRARRWCTPWRMQVTTSCSMRRPGSWNSTSLVTTVRHARRGREVRQLVQPQLVVGRRRRVSAR